MRLRPCLLLFLLLCASLTGAPKKTARTDPPPAKVRPEDVIAHLEESIAWYRGVVAAEQLTGIPSDLVVRDATLQRSLQALQLAFDFARAEAAFLAAEKQAANPDLAPDASSGRTLATAAQRTDQSVTQLEDQLKAIAVDLTKSTAKNHALLAARQKELQAELALAKQAQTTIRGMLAVTGDTTGQNAATGLLGEIETLERSVPEARHNSEQLAHNGLAARVEACGSLDAIRAANGGLCATKETAAAKPVATPPGTMELFHPESAGFVLLVTEVTALTRARVQLDGLLASTETLLRDIDRLKNPLATALKNSIQRGQTLAANVNTADIDNLEAGRREIEQLTARFQQIATATVPIGEQQILMETVRTNLSGWRNSIARQASETWKFLFLRSGFMVFAILVVFGLSEVWRRATLRYVTDQSKRRQFVVLRRAGLTIAILAILTLGFATDFSSLATYAGFLTAGVALGLQNVILSVVAYFFLIGKYGIKAGDRVTISGVTGDVIDVGLVRLYMMELGPDHRPTGRTVVYANSIAFQPSALFKQVPGADYTWHKAAITLSAATDYEAAKAALTAAVHHVYEDFRVDITQQHNRFEASLEIALTAPEPACTCAFTTAGLEFQVHYPADLKRAAEMDERILKALRDAAAPFEIVSAPRFL